MDEPFTGIDPLTISDIKDIIRRLRDQNIGILITDHQVREVLTITDRSYLIKGGKVRTHGTPQQIVRDPIAIADYLGSGFSDERIGAGPSRGSEQPAGESIGLVVEQEKIVRLVDRLRTNDFENSARELVQRGPNVIPLLLEAMERRDVEMRRSVRGWCNFLLGGSGRLRSVRARGSLSGGNSSRRCGNGWNGRRGETPYPC